MRKSVKKAFAVLLTAAMVTQGIGAITHGPLTVKAAFADNYTVPAANANGTIGATVPYTRYDSVEATRGGGASLATGYNMDRYNIASQASERSYVKLPGSGAYAQWKVTTSGRGVTMRFTMPDSSDGYGISGSLDVYVNGTYKKTVDLTSYYMWQYFAGGNPSDSNDGGPGAFAFDEVHFMLDESLNSGDTIRIQSSGASGVEYGVDFLEIEEVPDAIQQPAGSLNVVDFGANPYDDQDDYSAIKNCIDTASSQGKTVYFPAGTFRINRIWELNASNITITGAGMWYTNIKFTNPNASSGGISCNANNIEFCNMYINSSLRSRYSQQAVYKCFMDILGGGSVVHDVWEDHFECGFWMADYTGQGRYSDGLLIKDCRIRNNLADGVNFCQGTSNAKVYNCSIRNNGDDGLAMWNNNYQSVKDESNNVFAYNTIDFIWRAGGIAIYGGNNHKVYNNYICDSFMSSGIHLNTTFDGYKFNNTTNIDISNNIMVRAGAGKGSWGEEFGAIDVEGSVRNITFNNNRIYDSPHDAIRLSGSISNIVFNDTIIYGTGVDGQQYNYSSIAHNGVAILAINGATATFNRATLASIAYSQVNYINGGNVTLNSVENRGNVAYSVPGYPNPVSGGNENITTAAQTTTVQTTEEQTTGNNTSGGNVTIPSDSIALDGAFSASPLVKQWNVNNSSGYEYLGYAYLGDGASAGYNYLTFTYKGDTSAFNDLRWEFTGKGVFGLIATQYDGMLKPINYTTIPQPGSSEQTVIIDLGASGIDMSAGIAGIHLHQTAGNGNFEITKAYLSKTQPTFVQETTAAQTTTTKPAETQTTTAQTVAQPTEVIGLVILEVNNNEITFAWGQTNDQIMSGQSYKVYIDGVFYNEYSEAVTEKITVSTTGTHTIKVTANLNGYETDGAATEVNVENIAETTTNVTEVTTSITETTTEEVVVTNSVVIEGFQISATNKGLRTVYTVSNTEDNVVEAGLIYGLGSKTNDSEMVAGSDNSYVYMYKATSAGISPVTYGNLDNSTSYIMTMKFGNVITEFYSSDLKVRAYAKRADGSYQYSDVVTTTVYKVADNVYTGRKMSSQEAHNYLYTDILNKVNPDYEQVDYNWDTTVVNP